MRGAEQHDEHRAEDDLPIELVDLPIELLLPERQRDDDDAVAAAGADRRRGDAVRKVGDLLDADEHRQPLEDDVRGTRSLGVRIDSSPDANRSRWLDASRPERSKRLTSWPIARLTSTITWSSMDASVDGPRCCSDA